MDILDACIDIDHKYDVDSGRKIVICGLRKYSCYLEDIQIQLK